MFKKKRYFTLLSLAAISLVLMSWGYTGHYKINYNASLSFNSEMQQFMNWAVTLAQHASDADDRKDTDPDEAPRHYIDIDGYPSFITSGRIPQTYDSVVAIYGAAFVIDQGIIPWATKRTYDSLVASFARFDWDRALFFAQDLGHYVADGHMPLHITTNYDGQYSGNNGIHSRYESAMINTYHSQIEYSGEAVSHITDVQGYIFDYLYSSYTYVDSVLDADDYARALAGNTTSPTYKAALWDKTKGFTTMLFSQSSHALAELMYSAWIDAGKPDMNSGPGIFEHPEEHYFQLKASPNPLRKDSFISFILKKNTNLKIRIFDMQGSEVETVLNDTLPEGPNVIAWDTKNLLPGVYIVSLETGFSKDVVKVIKPE